MKKGKIESAECNSQKCKSRENDSIESLQEINRKAKEEREAWIKLLLHLERLKAWKPEKE